MTPAPTSLTITTPASRQRRLPVRAGAALTALTATLALAAATQPAHAIITIGDPGRNTQAPTDPELAKVWNYAGNWGLFTGTPVAPTFFLAAGHTGGQIGGTFSYQGESYTTIKQHYIANADLTVWEVDRPFNSWAPVYTGNAEVGKEMFVYGRGAKRGGPWFVTNNDLNNVQVGFTGSNPDNPDGSSPMSWGTNIVDRTVNGEDAWTQNPDGGLLSWGFYADRGPNTGVVYSGDSGGGTFIKDDDGVWKLAGIIYGFDSPYAAFDGVPTGWALAATDARGLYIYGQNPQTGNLDYFHIDPKEYTSPVPTFSYATRLSVQLEKLRAVSPDIGAAAVGAPEPASLALLGPVVLGLWARGRRAKRGS